MCKGCCKDAWCAPLKFVYAKIVHQTFMCDSGVLLWTLKVRNKKNDVCSWGFSIPIQVNSPLDFFSDKFLK
jgi:hypothetical protein